MIISASARDFLRLRDSVTPWAMGTGERSARGLALIIIIAPRSPANLSKTHLKFSLGWRNTRPAAKDSTWLVNFDRFSWRHVLFCSNTALTVSQNSTSMHHSWPSILENFEDRESRRVCRRPRPFEKFCGLLGKFESIEKGYLARSIFHTTKLDYTVGT